MHNIQTKLLDFRFQVNNTIVYKTSSLRYSGTVLQNTKTCCVDMYLNMVSPPKCPTLIIQTQLRYHTVYLFENKFCVLNQLIKITTI